MPAAMPGGEHSAPERPSKDTDLAGCSLCFGDDADLAWESYSRFAIETAMIDDSHFIVQLRRCPACGQRFLWIFTEFVDYEHGDDAQFRTIMPVTDTEAGYMARLADDLDLAYLRSLSVDRRYLSVDWPTGQHEVTIRWRSGEPPIIGPGTLYDTEA